jgi:uncharacterized protein (TIGR04222 family)
MELEMFFSLSGPEFLFLYTSIWTLAICSLFCLCLAISFVASLNFVSNAKMDISLNREELGFLARGPIGSLECALIYLGSNGSIALKDDYAVTKTDILSEHSLPLEKRISNLVAQGQSMKITELRRLSKTSPEMNSIRQNLESQGLLISDLTRTRFMRFYYFIVACLIGFGLLRLISGLANHKSVGFLIAILIIFSLGALLLSFVFSNRLKSRTGKGDWFLKSKRKIHAELKTGAQQLDDPVYAPNIALAIALFGVAAIGASTNPWSKALASPSAISDVGSSSDSSSCSSASSDSGSSSSCSGGGGCGGCGGGGD